MTGGEIALLVVGGNVLLQVVIWSLVLTRVRKTRARQAEQMAAELQALRQGGERVVVEPAFVGIRRPHAGTFGTAALTDKHLVLLVGKRPAERIALASLGAAHVARTYRGNLRGGRRWLVLPGSESEFALSLPTDGAEDWLAAVTRGRAA